MKTIAILFLFFLALAAATAQAQQIVYMSGLAPVGAVTDNDTTFWCGTPSGCGQGVNLNRVAAPLIADYVIGKLSGAPPIALNSNVFSLRFDSTLSIIGGLLHSNAGGGSVTQINAGTGLTGGTITSSGTIAIGNTGVTAGAYTCPTVTVNQQGQITSIANGSCGGGGGNTLLADDSVTVLLADDGTTQLLAN